MALITIYDNDGKSSTSEKYDGIIRTECCDERYKKICRLMNIGSIATMLRSIPLNNLKTEERSKFLEFQEYFVNLESECFDEANFE